MPSSKDKFRDPADPLWEARVNELEEGTGVGQVTTAKIAAGAVTEPKLGAGSVGSTQIKTEGVGFANIQHTTGVPAKPAEKAQALNRFPIRQATIAFTAEAAQVKFKLKHELTNEAAFCVAAFSAASEKPSALLTLVAAGFKVLSAEELEVELSAAPGAGVEVFFQVIG